MSNAVFPLNVPGLSIKVSRTPVFKTKILESVGGREQRGRWAQNPRYKYTLRFEFLRQDATFTEAQVLLDFFEQHHGAWDSFLFDDPYDNVQRRVRFERDDLPMDRLFMHIWEAKTLGLISVI